MGDAKRPRGHGSLWGAADTVIQISGGRDDPQRRAHVVKQKDGDPGPDILFRLIPVELGKDEDGDPVTSCIVQPSDADPNQMQGRRRLNAKEQIVIGSIERALISSGVPPPASIPDNVLNRLRTGKVVTLSDWRSAAVSAPSRPATSATVASSRPPSAPTPRRAAGRRATPPSASALRKNQPAPSRSRL